MSTSPDDRIVSVISHWLGRHVGDDELRREIEEVGTEGLAPDQAEAVRELREELVQAGQGERGHLEMVARETLEAIALGR
jgi:hypothetical protein